MNAAYPENSRVDFEKMVISHRQYLFNLALSLTHDCNRADDLVQETYLKALLGYGLFRQGTNCLAWLSRILINTYINQYNYCKRHPQEEITEDVFSVSIEFHDTHDFEVYDDRSLLFYGVSDKVMEALMSLPDDYRDTVILSDLRGLPYEDISRRCGAPMGTIRSRLSRGRCILRKKLSRRNLPIYLRKNFPASAE